MKTILLLRHAKAEPIAPGQRDFDRPLAPRGRDDAARVGRAIATMKLVPDAILTSPARRAKETGEAAANAMKFKGALRDDRTLYEASGAAWLEVLRKLESSVEAALVVGHNPGIEEAAALLCGASPGFLGCPTAGLIGLESGVAAWRDLGKGRATLRWFLRPKLLGMIG